MNFKKERPDDLVKRTYYLYRYQTEVLRKMAYTNRVSYSKLLREAIDFFIENTPK